MGGDECTGPNCSTVEFVRRNAGPNFPTRALRLRRSRRASCLSVRGRTRLPVREALAFDTLHGMIFSENRFPLFGIMR